MPNPSPQPATLSKSDFADLCNVNKSRVSHWIKEGRIGPDALSGTGRSARIIVEKAQAQLRARLDPYQMLATGNGARTDLGGKVPTDPKADGKGNPLSDDAALLMSIIGDIPNGAAWMAAEPGETTQRAFNTSMNMRLDLTAELRRHGFVLDPNVDLFEPVNWPGLAEEMGMILIDPVVMAADWQHRRDTDD